MTGVIYYSSVKIETSIPEDNTLYIYWHVNPKCNLTLEIFIQNK
jgi:hypothetical protein